MRFEQEENILALNLKLKDELKDDLYKFMGVILKGYHVQIC